MFGEGSPRQPSPWQALASSLPDAFQPAVRIQTPNAKQENEIRQALKLDMLDASSSLSPNRVETGPFHMRDRPDIPRLVAEEDELGHIEYKLKLTAATPERFAKLVTQLHWRLQQGCGEALYEIGVLDSGALVGLSREDLEESIGTLRQMATAVGAEIVSVTEVELARNPNVVGTNDIATLTPETALASFSASLLASEQVHKVERSAQRRRKRGPKPQRKKPNSAKFSANIDSVEVLSSNSDSDEQSRSDSDIFPFFEMDLFDETHLHSSTPVTPQETLACNQTEVTLPLSFFVEDGLMNGDAITPTERFYIRHERRLNKPSSEAPMPKCTATAAFLNVELENYDDDSTSKTEGSYCVEILVRRTYDESDAFLDFQGF